MKIWVAIISHHLHKQGKYYHVNLKGTETEAKTNCFDFTASERESQGLEPRLDSWSSVASSTPSCICAIHTKRLRRSLLLISSGLEDCALSLKKSFAKGMTQCGSARDSGHCFVIHGGKSSGWSLLGLLAKIECKRLFKTVFGFRHTYFWMLALPLGEFWQMTQHLWNPVSSSLSWGHNCNAPTFSGILRIRGHMGVCVQRGQSRAHNKLSVSDSYYFGCCDSLVPRNRTESSLSFVTVLYLSRKRLSHLGIQDSLDTLAAGLVVSS